MKMKLKIVFAAVVLLLVSNNTTASDDPLIPVFPKIPASYEVLNPNKLVTQSQINFPAYIVRNTNGYRVTTPEGNELIVDNIVQPKCAFYASYITTDDDGFLSLGSTTKVVSNVYIGEVNFDNCK